MQTWNLDMEELEGVLSAFGSNHASSEFLLPDTPMDDPFEQLTDNYSLNDKEQQQQQKQEEEQPHQLESKVEQDNASAVSASAASVEADVTLSAFQKWCCSPSLPSPSSSSAASWRPKHMRNWILELQKRLAEDQKMNKSNKSSTIKQEVTAEEQRLRLCSSSVRDMATTSCPAEARIQNSSYNHKMAERNRRKMEAQYLSVLKTCIPASKKKDKVSTLKASVEHIKDLVSTVNSLKKEGTASTIPDCIKFIRDLVRKVDTLEKKLNSSSADEEVSKCPSILTQEEDSST